MLDVATRPDCLGEDVIELLERLNRIKPVWVELGLQTMHERTAKAINRGYALDCFESAMARLSAAGLETIVHVILYLPGESREDMEQTVRYVAASGAQGIKLQLLHILEGTPMAQQYRRGEIILPEREEYCELIADLLAMLPPDMVVHRITGDGDKRYLLAPLWSADKKKVLNELKRRIEQKQRK